MKGQGNAMPDAVDESVNGSVVLGEIFDLADLKAANTAELAIIHPVTKLATTWVWTFAGPGHPVTRALSERLGKKDRAEAFQREKAMFTGRDPKEKSNNEVIAENALRFGGRVLGWTPIVMNGQELAYSQQKAIEILADPDYGWLYTQVFNFLRDDETFLKSSKTT